MGWSKLVDCGPSQEVHFLEKSENLLKMKKLFKTFYSGPPFAALSPELSRGSLKRGKKWLRGLKDTTVYTLTNEKNCLDKRAHYRRCDSSI